MELYILPQRVRVASIRRGAISKYMHALLRLAFYPTTEDFFSLTATKDEYTMIIDEEKYQKLPPSDDLSVQPDTWRLLQLCEGDIDPGDWINKTGIVKSVTKPLADALITIFYMSTYQTDFIMVPEKKLAAATKVLSANFKIFDDSNTGDDYDEFGNSVPKKTVTAHVQSPDLSTSDAEAALPPPKRLHSCIVHSKHIYLACVPRDFLSSVALTLIELMFYAEEQDKDSDADSNPMDRFFSYSIVDNTVSLVLDEKSLARLPPTCNKSAVPYRVIQCYDGPLGFDECGIVAQFSEPLADNGVHIYYISTFLTDYTLVNEDEIDVAIDTLRRTGQLKA